MWTGPVRRDGQRLHFLDRQIRSRRPARAVVELGHGVQDAAVAPRDLEPDGADRRLDGDDLALQTLARRPPEYRSPIVVVSRKMTSAIGARRSGGATTVSSVPGRFFFICTGT